MAGMSSRPVRKAVLLDRDGVINVDTGYAHRPEDLVFMPGAVAAVRRLNQAGRLVIVITNQSGIARGFYDEAAVDAFHGAMSAALEREGARIDAYYHCPFHEDATVEAYRHADHPDRKPNPGMVLRALRDFDVAPDQAFLIGDRGSDIQAAMRAGVRGYLYANGDLDAFVEGVLASEEAPRPDTELAALARKLTSWLMDEALPLWWRVGADHQRGGFHEAIGLDGHPVEANRRARVQARQVFAYAVGGAMGWAGPWTQAVGHGLDFFRKHYPRPDGLYSNAVTPQGAPVEAPVSLYEQAFALLALATASQALARPALMADAAQLLERLSAMRRAPAGGFIELAGDQPYWANPHMHLLEAAMACEAADPGGPWRALADEMAELCLAKFLDAETGALREYYDETWTPALGIAGRLVEPGHQFEWAWLLETWGVSRGRADARAAARRLYQVGAGAGIDRMRGVAMYELLDDGSVHDPRARLWAQTEWLRVALFLGRSEPDAAQRARYRIDAATAARTVLRYLETPVRGLWRDQLTGAGAWVDEPAPASSLYHIIGAIRELANPANH